ncbi:ribulose-phosphate 3-epimerase [Candidatus Giovannonibacteria bacterium]|nr:ribulose-phosphate 3-epimerase [Candidatus Giovannonibacteria bacterium]
MIEVVPAINAESFEEVVRKIKKIEPFSRWVHIDIADGTFTPNSIWHHSEDLMTLDTPLFVELHLMIADMDLRWRDWTLPAVNRIIFHFEAAHDPTLVIGKIHDAGQEAGIAIRPETDWHKVEPFLTTADLVQTLAVPPGKPGQEFRPEVIDKIRALSSHHDECIIEVDGGINQKTGKECVEAGAKILVSANYIFNAPDIGKAIEELRSV